MQLEQEAMQQSLQTAERRKERLTRRQNLRRVTKNLRRFRISRMEKCR